MNLNVETGQFADHRTCLNVRSHRWPPGAARSNGATPRYRPAWMRQAIGFDGQWLTTEIIPFFLI